MMLVLEYSDRFGNLVHQTLFTRGPERMLGFVVDDFAARSRFLAFGAFSFSRCMLCGQLPVRYVDDSVHLRS
jgi:hypothetical protein